jgi:hypothetical protein
MFVVGVPQKRLILDQLANTFGFAFSLRRIRSGYRGPLIRVRRASDNVEREIYYDVAGNLDTSDLLSFIGASSGFVTIWYDQSDQGRNATQTTAARQPRIVNAGVLETSNGRPALFGTAGSTFMTMPTDTVTVQTVNAVYRKVADGDEAILLTLATNRQLWRVDSARKPAVYYTTPGASSASTFNMTALSIVTFVRYGGVNATPYQNGVAGGVITQSAGAVSYDSIASLGGPPFTYWNGSLSELILMPSDSDFSRLVLERDQAQYYGITLAV